MVLEAVIIFVDTACITVNRHQWFYGFYSEALTVSGGYDTDRHIDLLLQVGWYTHYLLRVFEIEHTHKYTLL
jgi:hypothetical protein